MKRLFLNLYRFSGKLEGKSTVLFNRISGKEMKIFHHETGDEYNKFPFMNLWVKRLK